MIRLFVLMVALAGCGNDCSYTEKCDGDLMMTCGEGPDQFFNRSEHAFDCSEAYINGICVKIDSSHVTCASEPLTGCDQRSFEPWCDDEAVLVTCNGVWYAEEVDYQTSYLGYVECDNVCADTENGYSCK